MRAAANLDIVFKDDEYCGWVLHDPLSALPNAVLIDALTAKTAWALFASLFDLVCEEREDELYAGSPGYATELRTLWQRAAPLPDFIRHASQSWIDDVLSRWFS